MWVLATGETELLLEITLHEWVGANGGEETSIDCLLIGLALLRGGVFLVLLLEDTLFSLLGWGGALEVGVIDTVWNGNTRNVQLGRGGDDGRLSAATEWDTVNLVWASDQKETRLELLQKNNALTTVNTGKKDQDGTWGN